MKIWIDAHISPAIARWIHDRLSIEAFHLRQLGLREAEDEIIYQSAKNENVIFMTKDEDFVGLLERFGSPPKVITPRRCRGLDGCERPKGCQVNKFTRRTNLVGSEPLGSPPPNRTARTGQVSRSSISD